MLLRLLLLLLAAHVLQGATREPVRADHGIVVAAEEADLAFQFTLEMRNKIVEAYQEISRLQV